MGERLKKLRGTITDLDDQINKEFEKYSGDVRYFAEYQTGLQDFYPRLVEAEDRISEGLVTPQSLVESENTLTDTKSFQTSLEELIKVLENAGQIAKKMSHHEHSDITVASFRIRWDNAHKTSKVWVHCMEELFKCWNDLEEKIVTLTTWVDTSKSSEPAKDGLSIDKLEEQLNVLKAKCKAQNDGRRKSQVNMNVRRMTMLPVEEMRKLSQMVKEEENKKSDDEYPEVPKEGDAPAGEDAPAAAETPADAPAAPAAEEEVKGEPEL